MNIFKTIAFASCIVFACTPQVSAEAVEIPADLEADLRHHVTTLKINRWCDEHEAYSDADTVTYIMVTTGSHIQKLLVKSGLSAGITEDHVEWVNTQFEHRVKYENMPRSCASQELLAQGVAKTLTDIFLKLDSDH